MKASVHSQITLAGKRFNVSRDPKGTCFIGDETAAAFVERMTLLGRQDVLEDLAAIGRAKIDKTLLCGSAQMTAWALHQKRTWTN